MPGPGGYWTTKDYFDPSTGWEHGMQMRRMREAEETRREATKQHAVDVASEEAWKRREFGAKAAQVGAQLGVEPVIGPDGFPDPMATESLGLKKRQDDALAAALGQRHAIMEAQGGGGYPMTEEEIKISQSPAYHRAKEDVEFRFELENIKNQRSRRAAGEFNTMDVDGVKFITTPNGGLQRVPTGAGTDLEPMIDKATGKKVPGMWRDSSGRVHNVRQSEMDALMNAEDGGPAAPPTAGAPLSATGTNAPPVTAARRFRFNPSTGKRELVP